MEVKTLEERIREEMTVNVGSALERNFETAKKMMSITPEGKVNLNNRERLGGEDKIILYLIGKVYAKKAGYANDEQVPNKELLDELGIKEGSLLPWLKNLRDGNRIKQVTRENLSYHFIPHNLISSELERISTKIQ